eukprot:jgi/Ulvmu1/97/UM001_0100.1
MDVPGLLIPNLAKYTEDLGQGTFGSVKKALVQTHHIVAVKRGQTLWQRRSLWREANVARKLAGCAHILPLLAMQSDCVAADAAGTASEIAFPVCDGRDLEDMMRAELPRREASAAANGRDALDEPVLPARLFVPIMRGILRALQHAHARGVVHLDLKPANVMLRVKDDPESVVVIDWGVAVGRGYKLYTGQGTPGFWAPEFDALPEVPVDGQYIPAGPEHDVYSLGMLAARLLTECKPDDLRGMADRGNLGPWVTRACGLDVAVMLCGALHRDPQQRPTIDAMLAVVERIHAGLQPAAPLPRRGLCAAMQDVRAAGVEHRSSAPGELPSERALRQSTAPAAVAHLLPPSQDDLLRALEGSATEDATGSDKSRWPEGADALTGSVVGTAFMFRTTAMSRSERSLSSRSSALSGAPDIADEVADRSAPTHEPVLGELITQPTWPSLPSAPLADSRKQAEASAPALTIGASLTYGAASVQVTAGADGTPREASETVTQPFADCSTHTEGNSGVAAVQTEDIFGGVATSAALPTSQHSISERNTGIASTQLAGPATPDRLDGTADDSDKPLTASGGTPALTPAASAAEHGCVVRSAADPIEAPFGTALQLADCSLGPCLSPVVSHASSLCSLTAEEQQERLARIPADCGVLVTCPDDAFFAPHREIAGMHATLRAVSLLGVPSGPALQLAEYSLDADLSPDVSGSGSLCSVGAEAPAERDLFPTQDTVFGLQGSIQPAAPASAPEDEELPRRDVQAQQLSQPAAAASAVEEAHARLTELRAARELLSLKAAVRGGKKLRQRRRRAREQKRLVLDYEIEHLEALILSAAADVRPLGLPHVRISQQGAASASGGGAATRTPPGTGGTECVDDAWRVASALALSPGGSGGASRAFSPTRVAWACESPVAGGAGGLVQAGEACK